MRHTRLLAAVLCAAVLVPGCSASPNRGTAATALDSSGTRASTPGSAAVIPPPGRTPKRGGRVEIVGTLQRDESGSWLIIDALPAAAPSGHVIGRIVNPGSLPAVDLEALDNAYVLVTGTASTGVATDKSDLGVIADTVREYQVR